MSVTERLDDFQQHHRGRACLSIVYKSRWWLGLLAWLFLASVAIVLSAEIDVVRYKRLYPRSLLTPFTDNVDLTWADRRTYTEIATAQQVKGFESVTVSFEATGGTPG